MEIPLNAHVLCTDGEYGRSEYVLINPVIDQITNLVVKEDSFPNKETIVPVDLVAESSDDGIQLRCSKADLEKMDPFIKTTFIEEKVPENFSRYGGGLYMMGSTYYMPFVTQDITMYEPVEKKQIPPGELAVRRGTRVEATDGKVGTVDEFVVNPKNGHITDLVLREGHLWGKKDVIIPVSEIGETREDAVFLKLNKKQIEALPTFPLNRHWS
jgi:sporulation protein YlmC with PRC-barrel domain